ncbi:MAG: hypothetical protein ACKPKO_61535, partial [Candidatus Fonsibacter sp.]
MMYNSSAFHLHVLQYACVRALQLAAQLHCTCRPSAGCIMADVVYQEIKVLRVAAADAVDCYGTSCWCQWALPAASVYWHFDEPVSLYVADGMAESRPLGLWAGGEPLVMQEGDRILLPPGYEANWLGRPTITILWQRGHVDLSVRLGRHG